MAGAILAGSASHPVGREDDADCRSAVLAGVDGEAPAERACTLRDRVEARSAALARRVVGDQRLDGAPGTLDHAHGDPRGRPAPDRLVQRLTDDLVDRDLRMLGEGLGAVDVEVDLDSVRDPELFRERAHRRAEPLVPQHDRLQLERELAERADRRARLGSALDEQRATIRSRRELSFQLEPVVLRDQGFGPAVRALAEQLGISNRIQIDLDVDRAETLAEHAQVAIYQIIREALHQAIRRGPPTRVSVRVIEGPGGAVETLIADDAPGERRRASFDAIAERARSLSGRLTVDPGEDGGTAVRVVLPSYRVRR